MTSSNSMDDDTVVILDRKKSELITVPHCQISHIPQLLETRKIDKGPIKHPILCDRFHPLNPASCMKGKNCNRVHAVIRGCPRKSIHINWAWRSLEECTYPRLQPGRTIHVQEPTSAKSGVVDIFDSGFALKTRCVFDDPSRPAIHCAHFYYGRECHIAGRCDFAHIVYLNKNSEKLERAPPPCAYGRRKTRIDLQHNSQSDTPHSASLTKFSSSEAYSTPDLTLSADDQPGQYLSNTELSTSRPIFLQSNSNNMTRNQCVNAHCSSPPAVNSQPCHTAHLMHNRLEPFVQQQRYPYPSLPTVGDPTRVELLQRSHSNPFDNFRVSLNGSGSAMKGTSAPATHTYSFQSLSNNAEIYTNYVRCNVRGYTQSVPSFQPNLPKCLPTSSSNADPYVSETQHQKNPHQTHKPQTQSLFRSPAVQSEQVLSPLGSQTDTEQKKLLENSPCDTASVVRAGRARGESIITRVGKNRWSFNPYNASNILSGDDSDPNESTSAPGTPS